MSSVLYYMCVLFQVLLGFLKSEGFFIFDMQVEKSVLH